MITHYETLGVSRSASQDTIHTAFKALAVFHHPDSHLSKRRKGADKKINFADISAAYAVLKDPIKRRQYDAEIDLLNKPCPACKGKGETYKGKGFTGRVAVTCSSCNGSGIAAK